MRIFNLAALAVFGASLLTGCGGDPGAMPTDENSSENPSLAITTPADDAAQDSVIPPALDGRAAAASGTVQDMSLSVNALSLVSSWYSGSVAPGASQHWYWNNSSLTGAFTVALSPTGASTTAPCNFEVTSSWDTQQYGGEREFHFTIKNVGSITCGTNILLSWKAPSSTWATGGIDAGASKSWTWNNANPLTATYMVGVSPSGATSGSPCQLAVSHTWYVQQPSGEREFHFTVTNTGAIACQGDVQLAAVTTANSSWSTGSMSPGASLTWVWNNANPLDRVYVPGLSPSGATSTTPCVLEVSRSYYQQEINTDGTAERRFFLTVKNSGSLTCSGTVLLNYN